MSSERKVTVRYYEGSTPKFKGYEELEVSGEKLTVHFEKTDKGFFAKDVPLRFALKLHRSEAFDIVGDDGKVPAEFASGASPQGKPSTAKPTLLTSPAASGDLRALQGENAELKAQVKELEANLEEAARDYDALEKQNIALKAAQVQAPLAPAAKQPATVPSKK